VPVVDIVTQCCNGVSNQQLFFWLKTITSYENSGSKPVKRVIGRYKINLEVLKSFKSCKAMTDLMRCNLHFSKANSKISEK
jgi:hypothetical protein